MKRWPRGIKRWPPGHKKVPRGLKKVPRGHKKVPRGGRLDSQWKERIDATNRQREESRLQLTKELHRLQVEEKAKGEGAKARVQIVKNKEAKDTKEVTDIALYI